MRSSRSHRLWNAIYPAASTLTPRPERMTPESSKAARTRSRVPHDSILRRGMALALPLVLLTACRPHDFPEFPANYREFAYVTNGASGTVTVLDVVNVRVDREIPVGQNPVAVTASATRNEVYVVNSGLAGGQGSLTIINAENNSVAATIALRRQPVSIDLAAAGDLAYVAN